MIQLRSFLLLLCVFSTVSLSAQGWERRYDVNSPISTTSSSPRTLPVPGGFLSLATSTNATPINTDLKLFKVDPSGTVLWTKDIGTPNQDRGVTMEATSDGGVVVAASYLAPPTFTQSTLTKLNSQSDIEWQVIFGKPAFDNYLIDILVSPTGTGYWACAYGYNAAAPDSSGVLTFIDPNGAVVFEQPLGGPTFSPRAIVTTPSGGVKVIGYDRVTPNSAYHMFIREFDSNGNFLAQSIFDNGQPANFHLVSSARNTSDGGFIIGGSENNEPLLVKVSATGVFEWTSLLNFSGFYTIDDIQQSSTGYAYIFRQSIQNLGLFGIGTTGPTGNSIWSKKYGGFTFGYMESIEVLPDSGFIVSGLVNTEINSNKQLPYLIRADKDGQTFLNEIKGTVYYDNSGDCIADTTYSGAFVRAFSNNIFIGEAKTDAAGNYQFTVDTGTYELRVKVQSGSWSACAPPTPLVVTEGDTIVSDLTMKFLIQPITEVTGAVFFDADGDCKQDSFETVGYANWNAQLTIYTTSGIVYYNALTDSNGVYTISGITQLTTQNGGYIYFSPPSDGTFNCVLNCGGEKVFNFVAGTSTWVADLGVQCDTAPPCPRLRVSIATNVLRPCLPSIYYVSYKNEGGIAANDPYIEVTIPAGLTVTNTSIPWSTINGNTYTFPIASPLSAGASGQFSINVFLDCNEPTGATYCVEAHAYPDTICDSQKPGWDGAIIVLKSACNNGVPEFTIHNVGQGNMQEVLNYIVIEDNVLLMPNGSFQLNAGMSQQIQVPSSADFLRMEAEQSSGYNFLQMPAAWVVGCASGNGTTSEAFINQFGLNDADPYLDIFCLESVNSYDPNDKTGFPRGYSNEHFIEQNQEMEYIIRFQNTGTAPAINIRIEDVLDVENFDPFTIRPGASSHPYTFDIEGNGKVVFNYSNIYLPDSISDPAGSQGFVQFHVRQRKDVALGTVIRNTADIYFDNNAPIVTNETYHTVGNNFVVSIPVVYNPGVEVVVAPNPAQSTLQIQVKGAVEGTPLQGIWRSVDGRQISTFTLQNGQAQVDVSNWPSGLYWYEIGNSAGRVAIGKVVKM